MVGPLLSAAEERRRCQPTDGRAGGALFAWNFQAGRGVRCLKSERLATQSVGGCEVGLADRIASRRISPCLAPALALAVLNLLD